MGRPSKRNGSSRAMMLGAVAGMRSMTAPAVLSYKLRKDAAENLPGMGKSRLTQRGVVTTLGLAAAAELVIDKLPKAPDRISPPGLIARAVSGAFAGAVVCGGKRTDRIAGAVLGGLAAVGTAYGMYYLRAWLVKSTGVPDGFVALVEDAAAFGLASRAVA